MRMRRANTYRQASHLGLHVIITRLSDTRGSGRDGTAARDHSREVDRLARVVQYTTEGLARDVHYLYRDETVFGREQADVVFAEDPFMSRRHAVIFMDRERARFTLRDLGSSNGTAVRVRERVLQHGDQFRLGRHLFRYDMQSADGSKGPIS